MPLRSDWVGIFKNNELVSARLTCPYCGTATTFHPEASTKIYDSKRGQLTFRVIFQCDYALCRQFVYVVTTKSSNAQNDQTSSDDLTIFPDRVIDRVHESIPKPVAGDWIEAQKCFSVGAVKAAAVMCRRVLYGVLLDRSCKEHPLHEGIRQLSDQQRLPKIVEEWLTEIKDDGHDAAHPHRALEVPALNVAETMEYTNELLRFVYVEPFELAQRIARKRAAAVQHP